MVGRTIGHYKIEAKLGEGGMGVVYRAIDTRLQRDVAIKFLTAEAMTRPERRQRFVQEARAASALNHPNIVHVYDIDQIDGTDFIAMEYVAGQTLAEKINRKPLPLAEILKYAAPVAAALAKAHASGIIHRDLKPGNIMISADGHVKLLDFGLAKLLEPEATDEFASTQTAHTDPFRTDAGSIVGTAAYMSPEQAEGKKLDARSDIFSFGSVLYEMATGRRAFVGATKMCTLSAILTADPPQLSEIAPSVPGDLQRLIARCLRKDPERRAQHMDDVRLALEELKEDAESGRPSAAPAPPLPAPPASRRRTLALAAAAVFLLAALGGWWLKSSRSAARPSNGPILTRLTSDPGLTTDPAFSPAGNLFAYASDRDGVGGLDIWVKQLAGGDPIRLTRDPGDDHEPAFSPDGSQIAFRSERQGGGIYVVSTLGGNERKLADLGRRPRFSPDGKWIAYWVGERTNNTTGRIFVIPAAGGAAVPIQANLAGTDLTRMSDPVWSPDSRFLLFVSQLASSSAARGAIDWFVAPVGPGAPVKTGALDLLRKQGLTGLPAPEAITETGDVVFAGTLGAATNIWQFPLSLTTWKAEGQARRLTFGTGEETVPSIGKDGRLLFAAIVRNVDVWSLPADGNRGKPTGEPRRLTNDAATDDWPSISVDGKTLTFSSDRAGSPDVWVRDLPSGAERRLTTGAPLRYGPRVSADGSQVAYTTIENGRRPIYVIPAAGGITRKACEDCGYIWDFARNGPGLTFSSIGPPWYISWLNLDTGQTHELIRGEVTTLEARVSPVGPYIAFHIQKSPQTRQIFVAPLRGESVPGPTEWIPVTDGEGIDRNCYWSPDGNLIYYQSEREGYRCLFARHLDPVNKRPVGPPFAVYHGHHARLSLSNAKDPGATSLSVARDAIVFAQGEITGNVWLATLESGK